MSATPFVHRHRVRYHELDPHNHVYNSRYLEYVDVAMLEFLRDLGWGFDEALELGFDPLLARAEIDFRSPGRYDQELEVAVSVRRLGNASFDIDYLIRTEDGESVAEVAVAYVNVDPETGRPAPIPPLVRERLEVRLDPA
jgi:acyl-CoA thioester hydrolase